ANAVVAAVIITSIANVFFIVGPFVRASLL
ncbi:unnamed protein product, partial [marine sediment metagenome]